MPKLTTSAELKTEAKTMENAILGCPEESIEWPAGTRIKQKASSF
jgi:hypothetical protein